MHIKVSCNIPASPVYVWDADEKDEPVKKDGYELDALRYTTRYKMNLITLLQKDTEAVDALIDAGKVATADWEESPSEVLEKVNLLLKPYNLRIMGYDEDSGSDSYYFWIEAAD